MKAKGLARPGALRILITFALSILTATGEFVLFIKTQTGTPSGGGSDALLLMGPGLLIILAWHYSIGFREFATDKGFGKKLTESWLSQGVLGLYLLLTMPEKSLTVESTESTDAATIDLDKIPAIPIAKQIKLTVIAAIVFVFGSLTLPWMLWWTNYEQANDDYKHGNWNTLRIGFAENALQQFPNSKDMAKVFVLKAKIYQSEANQMRGNLSALDKKEATERQKEIDQCEKVAKEADLKAAKLSSENWGVSSTVAFGAIGLAFAVMLALAWKFLIDK